MGRSIVSLSSAFPAGTKSGRSQVPEPPFGMLPQPKQRKKPTVVSVAQALIDQPNASRMIKRHWTRNFTRFISLVLSKFATHNCLEGHKDMGRRLGRQEFLKVSS